MVETFHLHLLATDTEPVADGPSGGQQLAIRVRNSDSGTHVHPSINRTLGLLLSLFACLLLGITGCSNSRLPGGGFTLFSGQGVAGQWEPEVDYEAEQAELDKEKSSRAAKSPTRQ